MDWQGSLLTSKGNPLIWKANPLLSKGSLLKFAEIPLDVLPDGKSWRLQIISKSFQFAGPPILANGYSMDHRQGNRLVWEAKPLISKGLDLQDLPLGKK